MFETYLQERGVERVRYKDVLSPPLSFINIVLSYIVFKCIIFKQQDSLIKRVGHAPECPGQRVPLSNTAGTCFFILSIDDPELKIQAFILKRV